MTRHDRGCSPDPMLVAGVMSGTSADGVDVALVRVSVARDPGQIAKIELIGHRSFPYPDEVRGRVLAAMDAQTISVAELARLNWLLGAIYADAVAATCSDLHVATPAANTAKASAGNLLHLVGLHGQTLYHQPRALPYAGSDIRATWQTGEPSVLRERLGVPVVSDFRPADLAAGGEGAPLVPMLDFCLFRSESHHRLLLNLGGIANVSAIPAGAAISQVIAFDTGPANMVLDALMVELYARPYDHAGAVARSGTALPGLLATLLRHPYFAVPPPKSCGREQFGAGFTANLLALGAREHAADADLVTTATELTIRSIVQAYERFCAPAFLAAAGTELIVAGGGARNTFLIERLRQEFRSHNVSTSVADDFGLPAEAKEAVAFALLAWLSWKGLAGNVPSATGAARSTVLGKVTC